jgi:hypothetical protein
MIQTRFLEEFRNYSISERLTILEAALRLIREDLQRTEPVPTKRQLATAAEALIADYTMDTELVAFTSLDGEDLYA